MTAGGQTAQIEGHQVRLTNLGKVLYPATGTTKGEVLDYYARVAPVLLRYVADRPVTRKRWPDGVGEDGEHKLVFFTKNLDSGTPDWVRHVPIQHSDRTNDYPLVNDLATLTQMAQLAALELHVPQWRFDAQGRPLPPDRLVLDLDPGPGVGLAACAEVAGLARDLLEQIGLSAVPVTSGSKGIHLYAPLDGDHSTQQASELAREIARTLERARPDTVTSQMRKDLRPGKVFVDWSQNNGNKTTVAPYSLRGRRLPTVAAPRRWAELDDPGLSNLLYTDVLERLAEQGDLLSPILDAAAAPRPGAPTPPRDRLATYRGMRDAAKTPEPVPAEAPVDQGGRSFVIQEHHARALHYDFRLERDGVLVSWAVPKGIPASPAKNHLAVHTEDHPLAYAGFEGSIPAGEYGGGEVRIFDAGRYRLHKWRPGREVIVTLHGRPDGGLGGAVTVALIHTGDGDGERPKQQWLLHRMAEPPDDEDGEASGPGPLPEEVEPMHATAADAVPGPAGDWAFEVDWTGVRVLAYLAGPRVRLSAEGVDVTAGHPEIAEALGRALPGGASAVLDGVAVGKQLCVVDLLRHDGRSLLRRPYTERRGRLAELLGASTGRVQVPPELPGGLTDALAAAEHLGAPGVLAKARGSVYQPGKRAKTWLRIAG